MKNKVNAAAAVTALGVEVLHKQLTNTKAADGIAHVLGQSFFQDADAEMVKAARNVVLAIVRGDIPNVKITY